MRSARWLVLVTALLGSACASSRPSTAIDPQRLAAARPRPPERLDHDESDVQAVRRGALWDLWVRFDAHEGTPTVRPRVWTEPVVEIEFPPGALGQARTLALVAEGAIVAAEIRDDLLVLHLADPTVVVEVVADASAQSARVTLTPHRCKGCELDGSACGEWVSDACGPNATCAGFLDCSLECCGVAEPSEAE